MNQLLLIGGDRRDEIIRTQQPREFGLRSQSDACTCIIPANQLVRTSGCVSVSTCTKTMTIYIDDDWNACAAVRKMTRVNQLSGFERGSEPRHG